MILDFHRTILSNSSTAEKSFVVLDPSIQMTIEATEGMKGQRRIMMGSELSQTEIKEFIGSNGLDLDVLDEREETLEA